MGARLLEYYAYAKQQGGLTLQMKLAMRTLLSEPKAARAADTPENVRLFHEALKELLPDDPNIPLP